MTDTQPVPTVPDEAVEGLAETLAAREGSPAFKALHDDPEWQLVRNAFRGSARAILAAAAPFIVAANQPEVDGDLRKVLWRALVVVNHYPSWYRNAALGKDVQPMIDMLAPAVEACVAARVAAARAEDSRG